MFGSKSVVGLDIGSSKVKAVQLRRNGNKLEIEKVGVADVYPGGDRSAGTGSPFEMKTMAARQAIENGRINAKYAVSAVAGESIIVRYIQLPDMPEAELKNALRWEAEEYIPFAIDEVNIDSAILGPSATPGKVDVLLVSARKDLINEHIGIIQAIGLTPLIVDVESFAFMNAFEAVYSPSQKDCFALLNIGAENTNINIYIGGTSRFSRDIGIAGNAMTQAVMNKTGAPFGRAEELKKTIGAPQPEADTNPEEGESNLISTIRGTVERITGSDLGPDSADGAAAKAIEGVLQQLLGEVRRSIQFFENQAGGQTVQRVFLGGGSSRLRNLPQWISGELEVPAEIIDPLRNVNVSSGADRGTIDQNREQLTVGIGLALRKAVD